MFILMRIGCIECSCPSEIVGLFTSKAAADVHANRLNDDKRFNWMDGGQNSYEVFELPEYTDAVAAKFF